MPIRDAVLPFLLLVAAGCVGPNGVHPPGSPMSVSISPEAAELLVRDDVPATQAYVVHATYADGQVFDVTDEAILSVDDLGLGSFAGSTFTSTTARGGDTRVVAIVEGTIGTATLRVRLEDEYVDPAAVGVPTDPSSRFTGPEESAAAPRIVYPADGVLVPPNLRDLEVHFLPGDGNVLFEIRLESDALDARIYTTCTEPTRGGCIFTPDATVWSWIGLSNRGRAVRVSIRGTDESGARVGRSDPISIAVASENVDGALYYWTTSLDDEATAIMRFDFAAPGASEAVRIVGSERTGGDCVGCHSLSRDGATLFTTSGESSRGKVLLLDVAAGAARVPFDSSPPNAFASWSPDGASFVGVFANEGRAGFISYDLNLFDGASGEFIRSIPVGASEEHPTTHPDWSADGNHIAFTRVGQTQTANGGLVFQPDSHIRAVSFQDGEWGAPVDLTTAERGVSTYYPAYSPDGDLLLFNRSACDDGEGGADCDTYDDPSAALYVMRPLPGSPPVALTRAQESGTGASLQASYPRWAPFTFRQRAEFGSRLHWLTFSSDRSIGLREPPAPGASQIWMVAVDPDACLAGSDGSYPAFALPFQDPATDNHTAQWAERAVELF